MLNPRHFLRMKRFAQRPASMWRVKLVFAVIGLCLILFAVERWIGWPEALSTEPRTRISVPKN